MFAVEYPILRASVCVSASTTRHSNESWPGKYKQCLPCAELDDLKARVPLEKQRIGAQAWEYRINQAPIATGSRCGLKTRAYHKLKEIFLTCAIDPPSISVHLCEAPGAFVLATSELVSSAALSTLSTSNSTVIPTWTWIAFTLHDVDAPVPMHNLPMESGQFVFSDVRDYDSCIVHLKRGEACLVTADGATEMDHATIEEHHIDLLTAQTRIALFCLRKGGTYILKFFEGRAWHTRRCIAWLTTVFNDGVSIIKPTSSRPTNSERYLVARGYVGGSIELPDLNTIVVADEWYDELNLVIERMLQDQIKHLRALIRL